MSTTTIPGLANQPAPALTDLLEISQNPGSFNISLSQLSDFYQLLSLKDVANGYAGLDGSTKIIVAQIPTAIPAINIADGSVDNTEFQFLNGVTSAIQTQIDATEKTANKGAVSGYAGLDASQLLLLANFPSGTGLQVLRRNTGNTALEFATLSDLQGITSINSDTTAAQILAGTTNRISLVDAGATHTFDIDAAYVGQASIITLGTITTGVWNGTAITGANINAASTDLTDTAVIARSTDNLSFFAATTSAQLAGVISDETGTGLLVFGTSPTIVTPTIASFTNAGHDHTNAAGGGQLLSTSALSDTANIAYLNTANTYTAGTRQDFLGLLAGTSGLNVGGIAGNPTTQVNGDIWLNTSTNQLFGRINGVDVDLGAAAGGSPPFDDATALVKGSADATKLLRFEVDGGTTAITGIIATIFTTAKTITIPDATDTLMGKATTDVMTNKSYALGGTGNALTGTAAQFDTAVTDDDFAFVSDNLSVFAATTSAQLAGVISDETGSGLLVFATSPTLTTPVISTITNTGTLTLPTSTDTLVGRATTDTLTNKTLTEPRFVDLGFIADANGNEMLAFDLVTSAVNYPQLANSAIGNQLSLSALGTDTNIDFRFIPKGTGTFYGVRETFAWPLTDETTVPSTGVKYTTEPAPYDMTIEDAISGLTTAGTGAALFTIDVLKETGTNTDSFTTIFTTKPTIDASEFTSTTAATAPVLSVTTWEKGRRLQLSIDTLDTDTLGRGAKIELLTHATAK